jgi:hypothetical protein
MEEGYVADGVVAQDSAQQAQIWSLREGITTALSESGTVYKYDVSLPLGEFYKLVSFSKSAGVRCITLEAQRLLQSGGAHSSSQSFLSHLLVGRFFFQSSTLYLHSLFILFAMRQFVLHFPPSLFAFFDQFVAFVVFVDFISSLCSPLLGFLYHFLYHCRSR